MKILYRYTFLVFLIALQFISCNEDEILKEIPRDFYSPENSYSTPNGIETTLIHLYAATREIFYPNTYIGLTTGTDMGRGCRVDMSEGTIGNYALITSSWYNAKWYWQRLYQVISNANAIISYAPNVNYPNENEKKAAIGEAKFFRALAYRTLAYLYGGVPIELDLVTEPKRNYVRSSREDVYDLCIEDYLEAAQTLPSIDNVKAEGRVSSAAAWHFLSEMYLATKQWDKAIEAASNVIDDPNFSLMTERFGSRINESGDVYWDLFQRDNQNRTSGNKEAIWVAQTEFNVTGGIGCRYEADWGPLYWFITDPDGVSGFIGPTSQNLGRSVGFWAPTDYYATDIWLSDWENDIRNNEYNMLRDSDRVYDNPKSAYYGKKVLDFPPANYPLFHDRDLFTVPTKISTPGDHPDDLYLDKTTGLLKSSAGKTWHDQYFARLAETYLFRAEAFLGKGEKGKAADDINQVRARSNASPVDPDQVDIDYILDERMRELSLEEHRRLTLSRLGLMYERTKKYNKWREATTIQPHNELFPIPFEEIERNDEAPLEQNPGYD